MSNSFENSNPTFKSYDGDDQVWTKIIVGVILVIVTTIIIFLWQRRRVLQRGVCLVGLCDSGKTLLFSQLIFKKALESFTSMQENINTLHFSNKKPLQIIDIPGHERVRQRYFDMYKSSARGIIFVIDSLNFIKDVRDVAEYLYMILLDPVVNSNRPAFLILCNKQDHALAKGMQVIKGQLEKEMNVLRTTKANQLEATSDSGSADAFLGNEGKDFEFDDLRPLRVSFAMASAQSGSLDDVTKWLNDLA